MAQSVYQVGLVSGFGKCSRTRVPTVGGYVQARPNSPVRGTVLSGEREADNDQLMRLSVCDSMIDGRDFVMCSEHGDEVTLYLRRGVRDLSDEENAAVWENAWAAFRALAHVGPIIPARLQEFGRGHFVTTRGPHPAD